MLVVSSLSLIPGPAGTPAAGAAAIGSGSKFGLVADVGTRYGAYGQQHKPIEVLAGTGAKWVKEEFRWDWVEPSRGRWTWAFMDEAVNKERAKGLDILGLLDYTAGWAVGESRAVSTTPPPLDLWANYVTRVVSRYKDRVHAWEVWNEPNIPVFWSGTKEQYAQLLAVTYDTIKRVDPSATVMGPTISGIDEEWLNAIDWNKIDVLGIHIYVPPAFLNDQEYSLWYQGLPNFERVVKARGNKPVWITEFGFSSAGGPDPWHVRDEGLQARYLVQQAATMLAFTDLNIEKIMPYAFNDDTPGGGFGLTRHDWSSRKPSYGAYRTMVDRLDGAGARGRFDAGPGVFAYRFARDGKLVHVVWAQNGGAAVIPSGGDAEVFDLYGAHRTAGRSGNELRIGVDANPIYVVHAEASAPAGGGGVGDSPAQRFGETGKTVRGAFLTYWQRNGGLPIYGFPISDEVYETLEDGRAYLVQYFERARFEWHPENAAPYNVLLGQFGRQLHPLYPAVPDCGCGRYFPETGHNVAGGFLAYWEAHGGLAQFGYPLTDQVTETLENGQSYTVQWFERARFELHPENAPPYDVLLGQFGRIIYEARGGR